MYLNVYLKIYLHVKKNKLNALMQRRFIVNTPARICHIKLRHLG